MRYLVVNPETKTIIDGPFLWAGDPEWEYPGGTWMLEAEALEGGFTWPPPPVFEEPPAEEPLPGES